MAYDPLQFGRNLRPEIHDHILFTSHMLEEAGALEFTRRLRAMHRFDDEMYVKKNMLDLAMDFTDMEGLPFGIFSTPAAMDRRHLNLCHITDEGFIAKGGAYAVIGAVGVREAFSVLAPILPIVPDALSQSALEVDKIQQRIGWEPAFPPTLY